MRNVIRTGAIILTLVGATGIAAAQSRGNHQVLSGAEDNTRGFVGGVPGNVTPRDYYGYTPNVYGYGGYGYGGAPIYNYGGSAYDYRYEPGSSFYYRR